MKIVYILISEKDPNRLYVGVTDDLKRRLVEHNCVSSGYSKRYAPWSIRTFITLSDEKQAVTLEKYLKSGSGFAFLKKRLI